MVRFAFGHPVLLRTVTYASEVQRSEMGNQQRQPCKKKDLAVLGLERLALRCVRKVGMPRPAPTYAFAFSKVLTRLRRGDPDAVKL